MSEQTAVSRRNVLQAAMAGLAVGIAAPLAAETPAQTQGPFFPTRPQPEKDADMTRLAGHERRAKGEVVDISGQVLDEAGAPIAGALVDVWQANAAGRYAHEADTNPKPLDDDFQGWAQLLTDAEGRYSVRTIVPGAYPVTEEWSRPPHIHFKVARRGYRELVTQMYFHDQPLNGIDKLLLDVPEADRAQLIVVLGAADAARVRAGRFNLVMAKV